MSCHLHVENKVWDKNQVFKSQRILAIESKKKREQNAGSMQLGFLCSAEHCEDAHVLSSSS